MRKYFKHIQKLLLQILCVSMTIGLLTPVENVYAVENPINQPVEEKTEIVVLSEDESIRDESTKTFIMSDKTKQTIIYSQPVHYQENGEWREIDNTLIDDGIVYVEDTSEIEEIQSDDIVTSEETSEAMGIQNNQMDEELQNIVIENEIHSNINEETFEITQPEEELLNETESSINEAITDSLSEDITEKQETNQSEANVNEDIADETTSIETQENEIVEETTVQETDPAETQTSTSNEIEGEEIEVSISEETNNGEDQVIGYKNKSGKFKLKFSKKVHKKNMVSIADGDYKVTWGFADFTNKSQGVVSNAASTENEIEKIYDKINQTITYANVIDGIDLVYQIDSLKIKENIVINKQVNKNEFTFEYKVNNLELVLNETGEIEARNEAGEIIFIMPKPFMYDGNDVYCDDVHYEIKQKNKKYTITIVADKEWMNDEKRAYPIVIDPVIQTETTQSAIDTTFIASGWANTNFSGFEELLVGKEGSAYINCRTLIKFTLPTLNRGDMIVDAQLMVASFNSSFYADSTPDLQVNAHRVTSSWAYNTVTWNTKPTYESTILDYDYIKHADVEWTANWKIFNITSAVKQWYNGTANHGIVLKSYNEDGTWAQTGVKGYLWPERYNSTTKAYPYIALTYRNNKGLESYWDHTSFSSYSAGNVYIDNYSGNLVVEHSDASTAGTRLPANISHVYNGYMAGKNVSNVKPYAGYGWKLNIQQTLRPSSAYGLTGTSASTYPYVYMDADGTEHYFMKKESQYLDEDGLGLELKVTSTGYTITDKEKNVMTFNTSGNITQIQDSNRNVITYTYSGPTITKVTGGNGQALTLGYDSNGYLTKITDAASRVTSFTYTNNLLTKISYPDGKTTNYSYDSDKNLTTMTSSNGTSVTFSYTSLASGKMVNQVVEKGSGGTVGQTIKFDRSNYNTTIVTTSGVDNVIDTTDDVKTELQFDDAGRLISTNAYTSTKDLGASVAEYTASKVDESQSNIQQLNKITKATGLSKTVNNLLVNHSGESTTSWSHSSAIDTATFSFGSTAEDSLFGQKSFKITTTASSINGRSTFYQDLGSAYIKPNTTYTASAYIKTNKVEPVAGATDHGVAILIYMDAESLTTSTQWDIVSEYVIGTTDKRINEGWRRVAVTFTTPSDVKTVRFNGIIRGATGTAYFDGMQLEEGNVANPYNMLENSSFERVTNNIPNSWIGTNTSTKSTSSTEQVKNGERSLKFGSTAGSVTYYSQTLPVNGTEEDTYIVSGWGYGKGNTRIEGRYDRQFRISIGVTFTDGTFVWKSPIKFNTSLYGWQYGARVFDLSDKTDATKVPKEITIYICDSNQANTLYFDHIQLVKKNVPINEYDENGNLTSSNKEAYSYTDNLLTTYTDELGRTTTYKYDDRNNTTKIVTSTGIKRTWDPDMSGNMRGQAVTSADGTLKVKTEQTFDSTRSFQINSIDEEGQVVAEYSYDTNKGLLTSMTDGKGNVTTYAYNTSEQLTKTTSGNVTQTNSYDTYGRLSGLASAGATYTFAYDAFSNRTSTKVGNTTLATYSYKSNNGDLDSTTLGNNYKTSYVYDEYGNVIAIYENGKKISEDIYDSMGTLMISYDYKNNTKTEYDYDLDGRVARITVFDTTAAHMANSKLYCYAYAYDDIDRVIRQSYVRGSIWSYQDFSYGEEDEVTKVSYSNGKGITYTRDGLKRVISKNMTTNSSAIKTSYAYEASSRGDIYSTSKIEKETIDNREYSYTYDIDQNITKIIINDGTNVQTITYEYDANQQLTRENNQELNQTIVYTYDNSGNIQTKKVYPYTTATTLGTPTDTIDYSYTNTNWKDQLTSYDGQAITYDSIGNPTTYKGSNMEWNGRELLSVSKNSDTINYTYDSSGQRTSKTVNGKTTTYDYIGTELSHEARSDSDLYYTYDENGTLYKIGYVKGSTNKEYYVTTNIRGDIEAIYNSSGVLEARYIYDSWGKVVSILDKNNQEITDTTHIGHINPFRYRGYYYDTETGLYYLTTRYYDPEVGRFISSDGYVTTGQGVLSTNMYAYCGNNPIVRRDISGTAWESIIDILSLGASIMEVSFNPNDPFAWLGLAGDAIDLVPFVTGVGETIDALRAGNKIAEGTDTAIDTYYHLKKINKGNDLEVHHIVEKRFSGVLGLSKSGSSMLSIAIPKGIHQIYTNEWRNIIKYGRRDYHKKDLIKAALYVYRKDPEMLGAALYTILKDGVR